MEPTSSLFASDLLSGGSSGGDGSGGAGGAGKGGARGEGEAGAGEGIAGTLRQSIQEAEAIRGSLITELREIRDSIESKIRRRGGRRGMRSLESIDAEIARLEDAVSYEAMSIAKEREHMRSISQLKTQRAGVAEKERMEEEIQALLKQREVITQRLDVLSARIRELRSGLATAQLIDRVVAVNPDVTIDQAAILTEALDLPADLVGRVIGRRGETAKRLERECGVVIDKYHPLEDRRKREDKEDGEEEGKSKGSLFVSGVSAGVAAAKARINDITSQETDTLRVSRGLFNLLMRDSAKLARRLEQELGLWRLGVEARGGSRRRGRRRRKGGDGAEEGSEKGGEGEAGAGEEEEEEEVCEAEIEGARKRIVEAKARLRQLDTALPWECEVEGRSLPSIMGTGGMHIQALQKEHPEAVFEIERGAARAGNVSLRVLGPDEDTIAAAAEAARKLIEEKKEVEHVVPVPADFIPSFLGKKGATIRAFQEEHNVQVAARRREEGGGRDGEDGEDGEEEGLPEAYLRIRGTRECLAAAIPAVTEALRVYEATRLELEVPRPAALSLLSSGGEGINKLRTDTGAMIDLVLGDDSGTDGKRGRRGRRGGGGKQTTTKIQPTSATAVIVVSAQDEEKLQEAKQAVMDAIGDFVTETLLVSGPAVAAIVGKKGATIQALQKDHSVSIDIQQDETPKKGAATEGDGEGEGEGGSAGGGGKKKKKGGRRSKEWVLETATVRIMGATEAVSEAAAKVQEIADENQVKTVPIPDSDVIPTLLGAKGAALRELQTEHKVASIDIIRGTPGVVAVCGTSETAQAGADAVQQIFDAWSKGRAILHVSVDDSRALIGAKGAVVQGIEAEHECKIQIGSGRRGGGGKSSLPTSGNVKITIQAPEEKLEAALAAARSAMGLDMPSEEIALPIGGQPTEKKEREEWEAAIGGLMGRGGFRLRAIQDEFGVLVRLDRERGVLIVRGSDEEREAARPALARMAREAGAVSRTVPFPDSRMGALVGHRGAQWKEAEARLAVRIDRPRRRTKKSGGGGGGGASGGSASGGKGEGSSASGSFGESTTDLTVRGPRMCVDSAVRYLRAIAASQAVQALPLPPQFASYLASSGLRNVERIQAGGASVSVGGVNLNDPSTASRIDSVGAATPVVPLVVEAADESALQRAVHSLEAVLSFSFEHRVLLVPLPASVATEVASEVYSNTTSPTSTDGSSSSSSSSPSGTEAPSQVSVWVNTAVPHAVVCADDPEDAQAKATELTAAAERLGRLRASLSLPEPLVSSFVGKRGSGIRELQSSTGCRIDVSRPSATSTSSDVAVVVVAESEEELEAGRIAVKEAIDALLAKIRFIAAPSDSLRRVIGRGGATIKRIQEESGANLNVDSGEPSGVTIRGDDPSQVDRAVEMVEEILRSVAEDDAAAAAAPSETIALPSGDAAGLIIGRGGQTIRKLQDDSGARIEILNDGPSRQVRVTGPDDASVAAAVEAIRTLLASAREDEGDEEGKVEDGGSKKSERRGKRGPKDDKDVVPLGEEESKPVRRNIPVVPVGAAPDVAEELRRRDAAKKRGGRRGKGSGGSGVPGTTRSVEGGDVGGEAPTAAPTAADDVESMFKKFTSSAGGGGSGSGDDASRSTDSPLGAKDGSAPPSPVPQPPASISTPTRSVAPPPGLGYTPGTRLSHAPRPDPSLAVPWTPVVAPQPPALPTSPSSDPFALLGISRASAPGSRSFGRGRGGASGGAESGTVRGARGRSTNSSTTSAEYVDAGDGITIRL